MESTRFDAELPLQMERSDIMEVCKGGTDENAESSADSQARVLRKRKSLLPMTEPRKTNRRVSMKPKKRIMTENANPKQIEALYLNKKVNTVSQTLETIYEEPKVESSSSTLIGGRKIKRLLTFQLGNHFTKEKIKKRRAKIKKLLGNKSFINRKKIPMNVFLKNIECLELDETVHCEPCSINLSL